MSAYYAHNQLGNSVQQTVLMRNDYSVIQLAVICLSRKERDILESYMKALYVLDAQERCNRS